MVVKQASRSQFYFNEQSARAALDTAISSDWADSEAFGTILLDFAYHAVDWLRPHHGDRDDHAMHFCTIALRYLRAGGYSPARGSLFNYLTKIASTKAFTYSAKEGNISHRETTLPDNTPHQDAPHSDTIAVLSQYAPRVLIDALMDTTNLRTLTQRTGMPATRIRWHMAQMQRVLEDRPILTPVEAHIAQGVQQWLEL